jgi:uncharacterized protein YecE (DUF72 family)
MMPAMAGTLYLGTSGFGYDEWRHGVFYPEGLPASRMLSHYATLFRSVEINYTFRKFPSQKVLSSWLQQTPEGFRFTLKANQRITHVRRLRDVAGEVRAFMTEATVLGDRLGPVLFQCPPTVEYDAPLLATFLDGLRDKPDQVFPVKLGEKTINGRSNPYYLDNLVRPEIREKWAKSVCYRFTKRKQHRNAHTAAFNKLEKELLDKCPLYRIRKPSNEAIEEAARRANHELDDADSVEAIEANLANFPSDWRSSPGKSILKCSRRGTQIQDSRSVNLAPIGCWRRMLNSSLLV